MTLDEMGQKLLSNIERMLKQNIEVSESTELYCRLTRGHSKTMLRKIALFKERKSKEMKDKK